MQKTFARFLYAAVILAAIGSLGSLSASAADGKAEWPNFRGPNHDGISAEKIQLTTWPKEGLKQLWLADLGMAYSSLAISGQKVYAMGSDNKDEIVYCLDAQTGKELWKYVIPNMPKDTCPGPRNTPAIDGGFVYAASMKGEVICLDAASGKETWKKDVKAELNLAMPHHMFCASPIVDGNLVLLNMGPGGVALDKKTGAIFWKDAQTQDKTSSYASPVPFTAVNKRYAAILTDMALIVVDTSTGKVSGTFNCPGSHGENSPDPVLVGDKIFLTTPSGTELLSFNGEKLQPVWWKSGMASRCTSPILIGDYVYGFSGNPDDPWAKPKKATTDLVCMAIKDGSVKWVQEGIAEGSLLGAGADGKLIILSRPGDLILAEASPEGFKEIARTKVLPDPDTKEIRGLHATYRKGSCWAMPVLCDGQLYVRNNAGALACYDLRGK